MEPLVRHLAGLAAAATLAGCPSDGPPMCVDVDVNCAELYAPTFANVYANTLKGSCGSTRSACHSAVGQKGGMSFETEQGAFDTLRAGRAIPGDASCSKMIVRIESPGTDYQMPPGATLAAAERCSLVKWVQNGATR